MSIYSCTLYIYELFLIILAKEHSIVFELYFCVKNHKREVYIHLSPYENIDFNYVN